MKTEAELRREIVAVAHRMYERGYVVATDGNVSVRLPGDVVMVTPSGVSKIDVTEESLVKCDMEGNRIGPGHRPTTEIYMHLEVYRQRADVRAVVHAHPPVATAFTIAGISLAQCVMPEVVVSMGTIPTAEYFTPSTHAGETAIRDLIRRHDAILMDRHGSVTVGKDVWEAYHKLEKLEHAAHITFMARQLGNVRTLPAEEVERLVGLRQFYGGTAAGVGAETRTACNDCGICLSAHKKAPAAATPPSN